MKTTPEDPCDPDIYFDCDDTNCVSKTLMCNGRRNGKFGWDEEADCAKEDEDKPVLDVHSAHVQVRE